MKHNKFEIATTVVMFIALELTLWLFFCAWGA